MENTDSYTILLSRISQSPGLDWVNAYLDLLKQIIQDLKIEPHNPRLVTSMAKGNWFLPVSVNNRYVLGGDKRSPGWPAGLIYGPEYEGQARIRKSYPPYFRFDSLRGEGVGTPFFLNAGEPGMVSSDKELVDGWISAVQTELQRARSSPYRKYHQPVVYRAAVDLAFREKLLKEAFPS